MTGNLLAMPQDAGSPLAPGHDALISEAVPLASTTVGVGASAVVTAPPAPSSAPTDGPEHRTNSGGSGGPERPGRLSNLAARLPRLAPWGVALVCLIGVVLRFDTSAHLWLDESLTVEIARRPLSGLFAALRHDGAPPLYYLLLHYWMKAFGTGDVAVRALSGVLSVATLPLAWLAGRRVGQYAARTRALAPRTAHRTGIATVIFFASSPYAIRYGSETRMYSLVVLLVLAFGLALMRALESPGRKSWALLTLATAALAYTHYWTFLLLGSAAIGLWWRARRRPQDRSRHLRALAAMVAASVLFLPWLPTFIFQMVHTGTPWAPPVHAQVLLDTVFAWAGPTSSGSLLALVLLACAFLGLTAHPSTDGRRLDVDLHGRMPGKVLAGLWLMPLALAYLAFLLGGSAYAERYTGIALPAFLLLCALGVGVLPDRRIAAGILIIASVSGLMGGFTLAREERTQAGAIAGAIARAARPGDVVAFCPDQLGPDVYRYLSRQPTPSLQMIAYADSSGPALVNWVDYADRMTNASGAAFAETINRMAGPDHAIFLVRADGYRTLGNACSSISDQLASFRDQTLIMPKRSLLEGASLFRYSTEG
jgi:mannosyltransferase